MHADNRSGNPHTGFSQPQYIRRQMLAAGSKHAIQCDEHSSGFQSALQQVVSVLPNNAQCPLIRCCISTPNTRSTIQMR